MTKEHLSYITGLVILFALLLMSFQPAATHWPDLAPDVAGAWLYCSRQFGKVRGSN